VKVWDLKTGECQLTLRGHAAAVLCVQFDDQKIVSGSYDKKIKVCKCCRLYFTPNAIFGVCNI
jgi:WD40 repeat protein